MKKSVVISSIFVLCSFVVQAVTVSPEKALSRVSSEKSLMRFQKTENTRLSLTLDDRWGFPALYVFNSGDNDGYMVVSADDCAAPLLGYTDRGVLDPDNIPPALAYWLNEYASEISAARESGRGMYEVRDLTERDKIPALVKTLWDQESPYNDDCVLIFDDGSEMKCPTGCVATAMAQIMNYYQYPDCGQGKVAYRLYANSLPLTLDFSERPFEWDDMLDSYAGDYTASQASAVAYLMKACGYSVNMFYSQGGSGADSDVILGALTGNFKYSDASTYAYREFYSEDEWTEMLYTHLSTVGPVIYNGRSSLGGHSFVCDGYDGNGYFHFNWGWSGLGDGYFLLSSLNPGVHGVGGFDGGYNLDQNIVFPVPVSDTPAPAEVIQYGSLEGSMSGNVLSLALAPYNEQAGWAYPGTGSKIFNFALLVEDADGSAAPEYFTSNINNVSLSLENIRYFNPIKVDLGRAEFQAGKSYKATLVTSRSDGSPEWIPVRPVNGMSNHVILYVTSDGMEVVDVEIGALQLNSFEATSYISYEEPANFKVEVSNPSEYQLSKTLSVLFFNANGYKAFLLDPFQLTVNPGETATFEWTAGGWERVNKYPKITKAEEFTMTLYDNETQDVFPYENYPKVMIYPKGGAPEDGITAVSPDKDGHYRVYNLSGVLILDTTDIGQLNALTPGLYIINSRTILF